MSVIESSALVLLLALICLTSCRRAGPDPLAHGWDKNDEEPLEDAPILERAKESRCFWQVDQKPDRITVSRVSEVLHPQEERVQTANGILIGEDHGEWGGSLSVLVSPSESPRKLLDKNVLQIFPAKSGFAVITGNLPLNQ